MKAWTANTDRIEVRKADSGWVVSHQDDELNSRLLAGIADDQGLVEFFAEQLALPAPLPTVNLGGVSMQTVRTELDRHAGVFATYNLPGPSPNPRAEEASAAAIVPPPVSALPPEVMAPFVDLGRACRDREDPDMISFKQIPGTDDYADVQVRHVRALLIATGLFTDDMRPSQPQAADASVKPAEGATSPPADALDDDGACPGCGVPPLDLHKEGCPEIGRASVARVIDQGDSDGDDGE